MLTIGEFSKLGRVSARVVRNYDKLGLLKPAQIGENGYRYYERGQLVVLQKIERLKRYGFSLAQIKQLLAVGDGELAQRIHEQRLERYAQLEKMRRELRRMEDDIIQMEGSVLALEKYDVIVMPAAEQRVFGLRKTINVAETHELFAEMHEQMERLGLERTGLTQLMYMGSEFDYDAMDVEAQCEVRGDAPGVRTLPGGLFATTVHIGPYESVHYAYEAVSAFLAAHPEYRVAGPGVERYLKDEQSTKSPEEYETAVMFRVEKV